MSHSTKAPSQFSSEGFDLSKATSADQVLELARPDDPLDHAESCKQKGNEFFQQHEWEEAYRCYTEAIEATPGDITGETLIQMQREWDAEQARTWREQLQEYEAAKQKEGDANDQKKSASPEHQQQKVPFQPPPHPHGDQLAVYYSNRAASSLQIALDQQSTDSGFLHNAIRDCTIAVMLRPSYVKAWVRRSTAYERQDDTEKALADIQQAVALEPASGKLRLQEQRLQKLEDERLEKLKAETMDKLKDLGNSLLGNFGLSLDNFKTEQDPNTGSYSISFQNN